MQETAELLTGMTMDSWKLSAALFAGSLILTVVLWIIGLPFFFLCLFIPIIPFLRKNPRFRRCPVCGWTTTGREHFCPFDATPLAGPGCDEAERQD
jgi:hypothetical protein